MAKPNEKKFGEMEFQGKDINAIGIRFDRMATDARGFLLMVSIVADERQIKQARAILCGGAKAVMQATGVKLRRKGDEHWRYTEPGRLHTTPDGYTMRAQKLGYGLAHALFITKAPGFMPVVTPEALWQELTSTRFTTPVLKDWIGYIEARLRADDKLENALGFNAECGMLTAMTKHLDEIVSEGLSQKEILIPRP